MSKPIDLGTPSTRTERTETAPPPRVYGPAEWLADLSRPCFEALLLGDPNAVSSYLTIAPELRTDPKAAFRLVCQELQMREILGRAPQFEGYVKLFPEWFGQLQQQLAAYKELEWRTLFHVLGAQLAPTVQVQATAAVPANEPARIAAREPESARIVAPLPLPPPVPSAAAVPVARVAIEAPAMVEPETPLATFAPADEQVAMPEPEQPVAERPKEIIPFPAPAKARRRRAGTVSFTRWRSLTAGLLVASLLLAVVVIAVSWVKRSPAPVPEEQQAIAAPPEEEPELIPPPRKAEADRQEQESLARQARQQADRARLDEFRRLRDKALFHATRFAGPDLATHLAEVKKNAPAALAVFDVLPASPAKPALNGTTYNAQEVDDIFQDCAALLLVWADSEDKPAPASFVDEGEFHAGWNAYRQGDLKLARTHFQKAQQQRPDHFGIQFFHGLCALGTEQFEAAKASLSRCLQQHPEYDWLHFLRGCAHTGLAERAIESDEAAKHFAAAEADFRQMEALEPDAAARHALLVYRGLLRSRRGLFAAAVADLSQAAALQPKEYSAYVSLAEAYKGLGQLDEADEQLDKAISLQPQLAELYRQRAVLAIERSDPDGALRFIDRAIALTPEDDSQYMTDLVNRANLLQQARRFAVAAAAYEAVLRRDGSLAKVHRWKAECLLYMGEAEKDAEQKRQHFEDAIRSLDRCVKHSKDEPLDASHFRLRGMLLERLGRQTEAVAEYSQVIEKDPKDASVRLQRGWLNLLWQKNTKAAEEDFEAAIQLGQSNGDAFVGRGLARSLRGKPRDGIADADKALTFKPELPRVVYNAARIYAAAAAQIESDTSVSEWQRATLRRQYEDKAAILLGKSLSLQPFDRARAFWYTSVRSDGAWRSLRRHRDFIQLASVYAPAG